jgi:beta-phosphoglucomutase-like phosphatase (HAD superfamily)
MSILARVFPGIITVFVTFRALVLFDIDGTLVRRAGSHHRDALVEGVRRVTGFETTTSGIPVHGMLDPDILTIMLRKAVRRTPSSATRCPRSNAPHHSTTSGPASLLPLRSLR